EPARRQATRRTSVRASGALHGPKARIGLAASQPCSLAAFLYTSPPMPQGLKRELLAEFLGTLVLMVFGLAVVAQVVLSQRTAGDYLSINIGWGMAVMFGCYVAFGVSG